MKKLILIGMAVVLVVGLVSGIGVASSQQGHPASKAAAQVSDVHIIAAYQNTPMEWSPILQQTIKTANQKDLFIDVSLMVGLYTKTKARSKKNAEGEVIEDSVQARAAVKVKVAVDGHDVYPGNVTFSDRAQTLTVKLQGILEACEEPGGLCKVGNETVELILETMAAHSFNFIVPDVDSGVHTVVVSAAIDLSTDPTDATPDVAEAKATIGKGSVIIEEVRMIQNPDDLILTSPQY